MLNAAACVPDFPLVARKSAPVHSAVAQRLEELRRDLGVDRKELAGAVGKRRQTIDSALRGKSNLLLPTAETVAQQLGASLEVVVRNDPVNDFRRALDANKDIDPVTRDNIWTLFEQGKLKAMRGRPKGRAAGTSK
jgi:DNA-binding XRE family transcriptional regulator